MLYHHVSPEREITPQGFERQLRWLLDQGYQSLSMSELVAVIKGQAEPERPGFVVTFDDGYLDNWTTAFPILKKLSVQAVMYLVTERIGKTDGFISWMDARAMAASGLVEFGSHTHTHRHFIRTERYDNLEQELMVSKQLVETELKRPCTHLAWPWGDYETGWWPLLEKTGFQTAMTTQAGANTVGTPPFALKRFKVSREDLEWLAGRCRWNSRALAARSFALMYGWDRRLKTWLHAESPYSHG